MVRYELFASPLGTCGLAFGELGLVAVVLPSQTEAATRRALVRLSEKRRLPAREPGGEERPAWVIAALEAIVRSLEESASDAHAELADIPLDLRNLSEFRRKVYEQARRIPRGQVVTYAELASASGSAGAARAIGRAMATNPFPIVVPCHRVISSQGDLHGFSAPGGVKTKAALLAIERKGSVTPEGPRPVGSKGATSKPNKPRSAPTDQSSLPFGPPDGTN